jgi:hypothetical protein
MKIILFLLIVIVLTTTKVFGLPASLAPDNALPSPKGILDLSQPPRLRWCRLAQDACSRNGGFNKTFGPLLQVINAQIPYFPDLLKFLRTEILQKRFPTYYEELEGLTACLTEINTNEGGQATNPVSINAMTAWNWLSELQRVNLTGISAADKIFSKSRRECSSIITQTLDGTILHARNDDASPHHYTSPTTVDVAILSQSGDGRIIAKATAFLGFIGTYTVSRMGVGSLNEDARQSSLIPDQVSLAEFQSILTSNPRMGPAAWIMRQSLANSLEIAQVTKAFSTISSLHKLVNHPS